MKYAAPKRIAVIVAFSLFLQILAAAAAGCDGKDEKPQIDREWTEVLSLFLGRTTKGEARVSEILETTTHEAIRGIARQVLSEWELSASDPTLLQPQLVHRPPIETPKDCTDAQVLQERVVLKVKVGKDGRVADLTIVSANPACPSLNEAAKQQVMSFLFRPASDQTGYLESSTMWVFRIDPK